MICGDISEKYPMRFTKNLVNIRRDLVSSKKKKSIKILYFLLENISFDV